MTTLKTAVWQTSGIPDSLSCIPDSKSIKLPEFQIPQATISRISELGFPYMGLHNRHHKVSLAQTPNKMQAILSNMTSYRK